MAGTQEIHLGRFEALIGIMLDSLEKIFVELVEVERLPRVTVDASEEVELAFELTYTLGDRPYRWLIECKREETAEAAVERLVAARSKRPDCRLIFLYHLERFLADDLRRALDDEDVDHYSLKEFGIRLDEVNCSLAEDCDLDRWLFRLELMKSSRQYPALRSAFSKMRGDRG